MENDNKGCGYVLSFGIFRLDASENLLDDYSTDFFPLLIFDSEGKAKAFLRNYKQDTWLSNRFTEELVSDNLSENGFCRNFRTIRKDKNTGEFRMFVEYVFHIVRVKYHQTAGDSNG